MNRICKIAAVVAVLGLPIGAVASTVYNVTDLGFNALALNNMGQVVGADGSNAILWDQGNGSSVIAPGIAYDINDFGQTVGALGANGWINDSNFGISFIENLLNPTAINNLGQVVGSPNSIPNQNGAYIWDPVFGFTSVTNVGNGGSDNFPSDVNDQGEVVGTAAFGEPTPFYWQLGDEDAQTLPGPDGLVTAGGATAINESGVIAASLLLPDDLILEPACDGSFCFRAAIYDDLEPTIIALGSALDINEQGWVVGGERSNFDEWEEVFAFLWSDDFGLLNLNEIISPYDPFFGSVSFNSGTAINDLGWIIADNRYLLTPALIPEPSTLALLGGGVLIVFVARRRKNTRSDRCNRIGQHLDVI